MTLPEGERLLITIDRKVEVQCDNVTCSIKVPDIYKEWQKCHRCHGTGRIKRSVRGWCEIRVYAKGILVKNWIEENDSWHGSYTAREMVVAACLDGTLPDEIAANIEITDIEESA